jgi:hypothetical protein
MWDTAGPTAAFLVASSVALLALLISWVWIFPEVKVKRI